MWYLDLTRAPVRQAVLVTLADTGCVTIAIRFPAGHRAYTSGPVWETLGGTTINPPLAWMPLPDPASAK